MIHLVIATKLKAFQHNNDKIVHREKMLKIRQENTCGHHFWQN